MLLLRFLSVYHYLVLHLKKRLTEELTYPRRSSHDSIDRPHSDNPEIIKEHNMGLPALLLEIRTIKHLFFGFYCKM